MYSRYFDEIQWKLVHHMDALAESRKITQEREQAKEKRKNPSGEQNTKQPKESPALKSYDQASSEIQVINNEL